MSEKIFAIIAVEKVPVTQHSYTFRTEIMEVEVVKYLRRRCGSYGKALNRFYYQAIIKRPDRMAPEYDFALNAPDRTTLTVNVTRGINPKWKRPEFQAGVNVVDVQIASAKGGE